MAPISGPAAVFGRSLVVGAEQAVEDINAAGGVLGQKLVLAVKDTACKAKQAPLVIRELVAKERVVAVVGFVCSGPAIAAAQAAREFGIPLIVAGATSDVITDRNLVGNVFRLAPRRDSAALPIVEHIALARISHEG